MLISKSVAESHHYSRDLATQKTTYPASVRDGLGDSDSSDAEDGDNGELHGVFVSWRCCLTSELLLYFASKIGIAWGWTGISTQPGTGPFCTMTASINQRH